jgi:hypothetical protein
MGEWRLPNPLCMMGFVPFPHKSMLDFLSLTGV